MELLILHCLLNGDLYGYQITQYFSDKSSGEYTILEGSMYPILYKLEDSGYISSYVEKVGQRRTRKFYHIEQTGINRYNKIINEYMTITDCVFKILDKEDIFKWEKK